MADRLDAVVGGAVTALGVASVGGTTKPTGLTVSRQKTRPTEADSGLPEMVVWWAGDDPPNYDVTNETIRTAHIWVLCRAKQSGSSPEAALYPLRHWAVKAMMADYTLGNTAANVTEGETRPSFDEESDAICALEIEFLVQYRTALNDTEIVG